MMFDESPDYACGPFRTQSEFPAAAVLKGVHFLLDDVGGFPERPLKQVEGFKSGGTDFLEPETLEPASGMCLKVLKVDRIGRQNVVRTANGLVFGHRRKLYNLT